MCVNEVQTGSIVIAPDVPGGVYLCQVSETVSCGACCGLYNVTDMSGGALTTLLERRTQRFAGVDSRNLDAVLSFRQWVENNEPQERPLPEFHHCSYIGLIGPNASRPGCLLHPLGNDGLDLRGISDYGGMACRTYFCPTHECLSNDIKMLIRNAARNWYEYGLMITEAGLIQAILGAAGLHAALHQEKHLDPSPAQDVHIVRELIDLKCSWPYRSHPAIGLIHYFFNDRLYDRPPVNYEAIGADPSTYDRIFQELGSDFDSIHALHEAEAIITELLSRMSRTLAPRIFRSFNSTKASLADSSG